MAKGEDPFFVYSLYSQRPHLWQACVALVALSFGGFADGLFKQGSNSDSSATRRVTEETSGDLWLMPRAYRCFRRIDSESLLGFCVESNSSSLSACDFGWSPPPARYLLAILFGVYLHLFIFHPFLQHVWNREQGGGQQINKCPKE